MIDKTAIIDVGAAVDASVEVRPFCHIMQGARIGKGTRLGQNVVMLPNSSLGEGCRVQNDVSLFDGVHCADHVFIGPKVVFTNVINPRAFHPRKHEIRSTYVEEGASIGGGAVILCGHRIGRYAMIGAGAVVTRDVLPYELVVGNPIRHLGWVSRLGHRLVFDQEGWAECPESGERYSLEDLEKSIL